MSPLAALPYVPITRHFRDVTEDPKDGRTRQMIRAFRTVAPTTWRTLLRPDAKEHVVSAVVLLAPSGAGKSTEVAHQTERLRRAGQAVFSCEAGAVATDGLRMSLEPRSTATFDEWLSGTSSAVLFLDAADEIYLRQRKFSDVARSLAREIDFAKRDVQVVVTARSGSWSETDRNHLANLLRPRTAEPRIRVVTFEPIDAEALAALATAGGANDLDAFLRRFEEDELYNLLDLRPCDVQMFVDYWNKHAVFGTWTQILGEFLDASFVESNPAHQSSQALSPEQGIGALQRIAVGSILTKKLHVTLPGCATLPEAMDARKLFADWEPRLLSELFANGLFDHKGEAAVQLRQGALTHFLAAMWFGERARKGWTPEELRNRLFVDLFNEGRWRVPASRLPVIGWVASEVPELRKLLLEEAPHILLYEGDPKRLTTEEIGAALRKVMEQVAATRRTPWPTKGTVRQLARPELSNAVVALLRQHRGNAEVERHLFRYVELGRYAACLTHALEIALDRSAENSSRAAAVSVVAAIGGPADRTALLDLLSEVSVEIRAELVRALVPEHVSGDAVVHFLVRVDDHQLRWEVRRVIDRVALQDVDAALERLLPLLQSSTITAETESQFAIAIVLVLSRLRRDAPPALWIGDVVVALERHWDIHFVSTEDRAELSSLLGADSTTRRAAWEARIRRAGDGEIQMLIARPRLGPLSGDDIVWLYDQHKRASTEVLQRELLWAIDGFYQTSTDATRAALRARPDLPAELVTRFRETEVQRIELEALERARKDTTRLEAEKTRRENIAALLPKRVALESGEDLQLLLWGWAKLRHPDTARSRIDLGELRKLVGDDLTASFARGFKACWRRHQVPLPEPGKNSTPLVLLAGLTGLTLEIRDGLEMSRLGAAEVELAARYGLYELNAFPVWYDELRAAHPAIVRKVLHDVLEREWLASHEHYGVMRFASSATSELALMMRSLVLELAETRAAGNPRIVRDAADALLVSNEDAARVAAIARRLVEGAGEATTDVQSGWMRVWAHLEPIDAAEWLDDLRKSSLAEFGRLVAGAAELLEHDFDARARTALTAIMQPRALEKWVRLLHLAVRPEDDIEHKGAFSAGTRDYAEGFRRRCIGKLAEDPSLEAHTALRRLRSDPALMAYRELLDGAADTQISIAVEAAAVPWSETDVVTVERGDERRPRSLDDLLVLVRRHLRRVGQLVENDEFSYRDLFTPETSEENIQRWAASGLRLVSRGLYSVVRENELDDDKKVDITALADGVGQVPIEIKPLGQYSLNELKKCVASQLYGKYMQSPDVKCGVLLLVRHVEKKWEIDGELKGFDALLAAVRAFADAFGLEHDKLIVVETIDLLRVGRRNTGESR